MRLAAQGDLHLASGAAAEADDTLDTGHDVHFLSRLERVNLRQTETALRLYRSPDLVRAVLADRELPEGAERVAIAIEAGPEPPHVLVQRGGVARLRRFRPADRPLVLQLWRDLGAVGHLTLLASLGGRSSFAWCEDEETFPLGKPDPIRTAFLTSMRFGDTGLALRAMWAMARAGKLGLPRIRQLLIPDPEDALMAWFGPALGLVSIGLAHRKLRAEVTRILCALRLPPSEDPVHRFHQSPRPGRNEPCPCKSGKKYKKCRGG